MTRAEGDRIALMVLALCRGVRDEVKRDDLAPSDWLGPRTSSATVGTVPSTALTAERDLTPGSLLKGLD